MGNGLINDAVHGATVVLVHCEGRGGGGERWTAACTTRVIIVLVAFSRLMYAWCVAGPPSLMAPSIGLT